MSETTPEPRQLVLAPEPAFARLTPLGFHIRATDFFEIAELARVRAEQFSPVASFLYCRALELSLKAYLLARGDSTSDVARFGHDLERLLVEAYARGIDVVLELGVEQRAMILSMNEQYMSNRLAYFDLFATVSGGPIHPSLTAVAEVTGAVLLAVERGCYESGRNGWRPW